MLLADTAGTVVLSSRVHAVRVVAMLVESPRIGVMRDGLKLTRAHATCFGDLFLDVFRRMSSGRFLKPCEDCGQLLGLEVDRFALLQPCLLDMT